MQKIISISIFTCILILTSGCSQKSTEYGVTGAASGAIGASMVGALTDLIVDGKVNTYRLQRNMVSGAIAGGTAGAIAGSHAEDKNTKSSPKPTASHDNKSLEKIIGATNYKALEKLLTCKHNDAYRLTLESAKASNLDYELSAYAIQALIDKDRKNSEGELRAIEAYIAKDDKIKSIDVAKKELNKIYTEVQNERRVQGKSTSCQIK